MRTFIIHISSWTSKFIPRILWLRGLQIKNLKFRAGWCLYLDIRIPAYRDSQGILRHHPVSLFLRLQTHGLPRPDAWGRWGARQQKWDRNSWLFWSPGSPYGPGSHLLPITWEQRSREQRQHSVHIPKQITGLCETWDPLGYDLC